MRDKNIRFAILKKCNLMYYSDNGETDDVIKAKKWVNSTECYQFLKTMLDPQEYYVATIFVKGVEND